MKVYVGRLSYLLRLEVARAECHQRDLSQRMGMNEGWVGSQINHPTPYIETGVVEKLSAHFGARAGNDSQIADFLGHRGPRQDSLDLIAARYETSVDEVRLRLELPNEVDGTPPLPRPRHKASPVTAPVRAAAAAAPVGTATAAPAATVPETSERSMSFVTYNGLQELAREIAHRFQENDSLVHQVSEVRALLVEKYYSGKLDYHS